jgi:hypothetical protein
MRPVVFAAGALACAIAAPAQAQFGTQLTKSPAPAVSTSVTNPTLPPSPLLAGGSDNCANAATADAITGPGTYPVDTTAATTGTPVGTCGGSGPASRDVWFYYTAAITGTGQVESCGLVTQDQMIIVWADDGTGGPGSCPQTQVGCDDDGCGTVGSASRVLWPIVAGQKYFIECGSWGQQPGYTGSIVITETPPGIGNDECANATAVVGNGPHAFSTINATTGAQGQSQSACLFFGSTTMHNDAWYTWVATASGPTTVSLCGTAGGYDSKLAVYAGAGCPTTAALACDDDSCGVVAGESLACFTAVQGQSYTIQIAGFAAGGVGSGTFSFAPLTGGGGQVGCSASDDGTTENALGLTAGGGMAWITRFGDVGGSYTVSSVRTAYETPPGGTISGGTVTVAVWDDPNDDGNAADAVLLGTATAPIDTMAIGTDTFQTVLLTTPINTSGVFYAGASVVMSAGEYPAPMDTSPIGPCEQPRSWIVGSGAGAVNLMNLTAASNNVPLATPASYGFPCEWLLRIDCGPDSVGTAGCFGDGTGTACPCANNSTQPGAGCQHSFSVVNWGGAGGKLDAVGVASVSADTVRLRATQLPPGPPTLFFQGSALVSGGAGTAFGDGLRCAGGQVVRLRQRTAVNGAISLGFGIPGDPSISAAGLVPGSGGLFHYQVWYRNNAVFCTPDTWNLTNVLSITWTP